MKKTEEICALLGADTEFEGRLKFYGTIRIDGRFTGEILGEGTLVVGRQAQLEAGIQVSHIDVSGEVKGNISANQRVEIRESGRVHGDLQTPTLIIREGAIFDGNCLTREPEKVNRDESEPGEKKEENDRGKTGSSEPAPLSAS